MKVNEDTIVRYPGGNPAIDRLIGEELWYVVNAQAGRVLIQVPSDAQNKKRWAANKYRELYDVSPVA